MRSRLWTVAQVVLLAAAAAVVPACNASKKLAPPTLVAIVPPETASADLGVMPNIIVKFDRAMNPTTVTSEGNFALVPDGAVSGVGFSLQHLPALNEVRIIPDSLLLVNKTYTVIVSGLVQSAEGTMMGANIGFQFDTVNTSTVNGTISFGTPTAVTGAGASGTIDLTWPQATESTTGGTVNVNTYDIYISTEPDAEDLMLPPVKTSGALLDTLTGLTPGTLYYIKIQPRDGNGNVFMPLVEVSATAKP